MSWCLKGGSVWYADHSGGQRDKLFISAVGGSEKDLAGVYITASGGALFDCDKKALDKVSADKVLKHPTWKMGPRITVDSATLVNKAFEVIETHRFFNMPYDKIGVVIHRESTVHALAECKDGTLMACIYPPDMCLPIAYSLYYPQRPPRHIADGLKRKFSLNFEPLSVKQFPAMATVMEAARRGCGVLSAINAADEVAVDNFLRGEIRFTAIAATLRAVLDGCPAAEVKDIGDVFEYDRLGRDSNVHYINRKAKKGLDAGFLIFILVLSALIVVHEFGHSSWPAVMVLR